MESGQGGVAGKIWVAVVAVLFVLSAAVPAQQSVWSDWRLVTPLPQRYDLFASATGGGTTVAVGRRGAIVSSGDGIRWDITHPFSEYDIYDVVWTGEEFVAVGGYGTGIPEWVPFYGVVLTSSDGYEWTEVLRTNFGLLWAVESTPALVVAVGVLGISVTWDGLVWDEHQLEGDADRAWMSDVTFDGSRFVAVGHDWTRLIGGPPAVYESVDGSRWTYIPAEGLEYGLDRVAWGNGRLVALDPNGILTSDDGQYWAPVDCGLDYNRVFSDLEFSDGWFFAYSHAGAQESHLLLSSNGESWVVYDGPQMPNRVYWTAGLEWTGDRFLVVSVEGFMAGAAFHPALGPEWTEIGYRLLPPGASIIDVEHEGSTYLAVGNEFLLRSEDGLTWQMSENPNRIAGISGVEGAFWGTADGGRIFLSGEGITWELRYQIPGVWFGDVAGGEQGLVAVGGATDDGGTHAVVATSEDGFSWDLTHLWDLDSPLRLVAWNGTKYAAVDSGDRVVTSTDGLRWEVSLDVERARWEGIAAGGGRFVTVGRSTADDVGGLIATSSDGAHWSETELEPVGLWGAGRLSDVTWTGSLFVAVSTDYGVMTSPNGTAWVSEPVGYGYPAGHSAGDDEHLVVVAWDMILRATHQPIAPRRADQRLVPDP